jgi:hypothetical protein
LGANAHRTQLCRRVRGNLLKSGPPAPTRRRCVPEEREVSRLPTGSGKQKGPDPFGIRASTCDRVEGARLMRLPRPDASNPRNQATRPVAGS